MKRSSLWVNCTALALCLDLSWQWSVVSGAAGTYKAVAHTIQSGWRRDGDVPKRIPDDPLLGKWRPPTTWTHFQDSRPTHPGGCSCTWRTHVYRPLLQLAGGFSQGSRWHPALVSANSAPCRGLIPWFYSTPLICPYFFHHCECIFIRYFNKFGYYLLHQKFAFAPLSFYLLFYWLHT